MHSYSSGANPAASSQMRSRVAAFIAGHSLDVEADPARLASQNAAFDALALEVVAHQLKLNQPYQRFSAQRGLTLDALQHWSQAPPVPTDVFKFVDLTTFPVDQSTRTFLTSGTTRAQVRGRHHFLGLEAYDAGIESTFRHFLLPDRRLMLILSFIPAASELPDSSLSHMVSFLMDRVGANGSRFLMDSTGVDLPGARSALEEASSSNTPVLLLGTAFSLVHFLDESAPWRIELPAGSRVMETGGLKGRTRSLSRKSLYESLHERLGLPYPYILAEYGMTELSSQLYDASLRDHLSGQVAVRRLMAPPWLKVWVVDGSSLEPLPPGQVGLVRFFDLANVDSVCAVQTSDLGRLVDGGLELLGRASDAEARGCSLTAEELLGMRGSDA